MKKIFSLAVILSVNYGIEAQVGIGTTSPLANLDVRETNPDSPTGYAGIAIPRVNILPSSGNVGGQIIYLTSTNSYYFYNNTSWQPLTSQTNIIGDVKYGFQSSDHNGWIRLDGRSLNNLTASQQTAAKNLFGPTITNLPDASNKFLIGRNGDATAGSIVGSNTAQITIDKSNLPNIDMNGTAASSGAHNHSMTIAKIWFPVTVNPGSAQLNMTYSDSQTSSTDGVHTHPVTVNTGGSGLPISVSTIPSSIVTTAFIYLGT